MSGESPTYDAKRPVGLKPDLQVGDGAADTPSMPHASQPTIAIDPSQLSPPERFAHVNRERIRRVRELLPARKRDAFDILAFLFHTNHEQLPGFVDDLVPMGINGYSPDGQVLGAASRIARGHRFARRALQRFDIHGIYLMGSSGSIAQTRNSDLDIWVCHPATLTPDRRELLAEKARKIELWAADLEMEVHFFVLAPEEFAAGTTTQLSDESAGSSQHHLLLDEFYRSALVLGGQFPRWIHEPPAGSAKPKRGLPHGVDFGDLTEVPAEEFFGAAIWQIYKSLASPFKSVLKLMLMEAYTAEFPAVDLLSQSFKRQVLNGTTDLDSIDPYLLMYRKVEAYLVERGDYARLELARRCFYLKVEEPLGTQLESREVTWRRIALQRLTRDWGWDRSQLQDLDNQASWRFHRVQDEGRAIVAAITASYRAISEFARRQGDTLQITQADLNTLGRRLYAAFERRPGKIEMVNRGIGINLSEAYVSLHQHLTQAGEERWVTYLERVLPEDTGSISPVHRGPSLVEALVWCHLNGLIARNTIISVETQNNILSAREARQILQVAEQTFPDGSVHDPSSSELESSQRAIATAVFCNVGIDPLANKFGDGQRLTTGRNNALSFGGTHENLLQVFDFVISTSWGEAYVHRYQGPTALADFLCEYLRWMNRGSQWVAPNVQVVGGAYASTIQRRLQLVMDDLTECFRDGASQRQFLLEAGAAFYLFKVAPESVSFEVAENWAGLMQLLGRPQRRFLKTVPDGLSLGESALSLCLRVNRPGIIQVVLDSTGNEAECFIADEHGSIIQQPAEGDDRQAFVEHLQRFFRAITRRRAVAEGIVPPSCECYCVRIEPTGERRLSRLEQMHFEHDRPYLEIKVLVSVESSGTKGSRRHYTILLGDKEFSTYEHGPQLFRAVAEAVRERRRGAARYPVYITDLEVIGGAAGVTQTSQVLQYKRMLEEHLSKFI